MPATIFLQQPNPHIAAKKFDMIFADFKGDEYHNSQLANFFKDLPDYSWDKLPHFIHNLLNEVHSWFNAGISTWLELINKKLAAPVTAMQIKLHVMTSIFTHMLQVIKAQENFHRFSLAQHKTLAVIEQVIVTLCQSFNGEESKHYLLLVKFRRAIREVYSQHAKVVTATSAYLNQLQADYVTNLDKALTTDEKQEKAAPFTMRYLCLPANMKTDPAATTATLIDLLDTAPEFAVYSTLRAAIAQPFSYMFIARFSSKTLPTDPTTLAQGALLRLVEPLDSSPSNPRTQTTVSYPHLLAVVSRRPGIVNVRTCADIKVHHLGDKPLACPESLVSATDFAFWLRTIERILKATEEIFTATQQFFKKQIRTFFVSPTYQGLVEELNTIRHRVTQAETIAALKGKTTATIKQELCKQLIALEPSLQDALGLQQAAPLSPLPAKQAGVSADAIADQYEKMMHAQYTNNLDEQLEDLRLLLDDIKTYGTDSGCGPTPIWVIIAYKDSKPVYGGRTGAQMESEILATLTAEKEKQAAIAPLPTASLLQRKSSVADVKGMPSQPTATPQLNK
jgi:hypothetical protein